MGGRIFLTVLAAVMAMGLATVEVGAVELGMTPSHVVSLWTNINDALITSGKATGDENLVKHLIVMKPIAANGKKPGDVLKEVEAFRAKLDQFAKKQGLKKATLVYKDPEGGTVTPSVVFVNSGYVLDSLLRVLIKQDADQLISGFYTRHDISGKKPNDAYMLVELANRRLDVLSR